MGISREGFLIRDLAVDFPETWNLDLDVYIFFLVISICFSSYLSI